MRRLMGKGAVHFGGPPLGDDVALERVAALIAHLPDHARQRCAPDVLPHEVGRHGKG